MKPFWLMFLSLFWLMNGYSQSQNKELTTLHLVYQNKVGDSLFQADSVYQNQFGESFKIRGLKYYISHLRIHYNNGNEYTVNIKPRLVNEADSISTQLSFQAPEGRITGFRFLLGIDSLTNVSGVQTGDLDPAKGMFWIWNTGYIMAKLEGASPSSKAPGKQFSYDIGGYKTGENAAREINLIVAANANAQPSTFIISADISKWFYGKNNIKISEQPICHSPGKLAMQIADNYADMFSLETK